MANLNDQKITVSAEKLAHDALRDLATALWREHRLILMSVNLEVDVSFPISADPGSPRLLIRDIEIRTRTVPHIQG